MTNKGALDKYDRTDAQKLALLEEQSLAHVALVLTNVLEEAGVSQRKLAERIGVTEARISQILAADSNPTVRTVAKLGAALGRRLRIDLVMDPEPCRESCVVTKEPTPLTRAQIQVLYTRGIIDHATWTNALRALRGESTTHLGQHAIATCEVAIEALIERAIDAACAVIQEKLGVKTGDLATAVLSDGTIERELTRYVHAELMHADRGDADNDGGTP